MYLQNVKDVVVKIKSDKELREKLILTPDSVDLSPLTLQEKQAVIEVFTNHRDVSTIGPLGLWT